MSAPLYSLQVLEDWKILKSKCKSIVKEYENQIAIEINESQKTIWIKEKNDKYGFDFMISNLIPTEKGCNAKFTIFPHSKISTERNTFLSHFTNAEYHIGVWIKLVKGYYEHLPENIQKEELTDFFFEDFRIHEADAENVAFDDIQQNYLKSILGYIENVVSDELDPDYKKEEILSEINILKENLDKPKNLVMKGFAKIKALIHLKGPEISKNIWEKVREMAIKYATERTIQGILHWGMKLISHS